MDQKLPCDHQVNAPVYVNFFQAVITHGTVLGVTFKQGGHIFYDIAFVSYKDDNGDENYQRLYNVPEGCVYAGWKPIEHPTV